MSVPLCVLRVSAVNRLPYRLPRRPTAGPRAGGGDLGQHGPQARVVTLAGQVQQARAGPDALEVDLLADAARDGGLGGRVDPLAGVVGAKDVNAGARPPADAAGQA